MRNLQWVTRGHKLVCSRSGSFSFITFTLTSSVLYFCRLTCPWNDTTRLLDYSLIHQYAQESFPQRSLHVTRVCSDSTIRNNQSAQSNVSLSYWSTLKRSRVVQETKSIASRGCLLTKALTRFKQMNMILTSVTITTEIIAERLTPHLSLKTCSS